MSVCCDWMDEMLQQRPSSGFRVVASVEHGIWPRFSMEFLVPQDEFRKNFASCVIKGTPVALGSQFVLRYCPRCGSDLFAWIDEHPDDFARLVGIPSLRTDLLHLVAPRGQRPSNAGYCCSAMEAEFTECLNQNGMTIVPKMRDGSGCFVLRYLWVHAADWWAQRPGLQQMELWNIETEMEIMFCPFCGKDIADWIQEHPRLFREVLKRVIDV